MINSNDLNDPINKLAQALCEIDRKDPLRKYKGKLVFESYIEKAKLLSTLINNVFHTPNKEKELQDIITTDNNVISTLNHEKLFLEQEVSKYKKQTTELVKVIQDLKNVSTPSNNGIDLNKIGFKTFTKVGLQAYIETWNRENYTKQGELYSSINQWSPWLVMLHIGCLNAALQAEINKKT